jgi:hypothetical protein
VGELSRLVLVDASRAVGLKAFQESHCNIATFAGCITLRLNVVQYNLAALLNLLLIPLSIVS